MPSIGDLTMREFYNAVIRQTIVLMLIYLAMGLFFVIHPDTTFDMIIRIGSISLIVFGIFRVILFFASRLKSMYGHNGLATGLILSSIGLYFLLKPSSIKEIIGVLLAFGVLIGAIMILQASLDLLHFGSHMWTFLLIFAFIGIIFFIICLVNPFSAEDLLVRIVGVGMLIEAVSYGISLILLFLIRSSIRIAVAESADADVYDADGSLLEPAGNAAGNGKDTGNYNGFESHTHFGDPIPEDDGYLDASKPSTFAGADSTGHGAVSTGNGAAPANPSAVSKAAPEDDYF